MTRLRNALRDVDLVLGAFVSISLLFLYALFCAAVRLVAGVIAVRELLTSLVFLAILYAMVRAMGGRT